MRLRIDASSLPRLLVVGMVGTVLVLLLGILGYLMISSYLEREQRLELRGREFRLQMQEQLQHETGAIRAFAAFVFDRAESILMTETRERVDQAHAMAMSIYRREQGQRSDRETGELIAEALRDQRFFHGRGYFFITDLAGKSVLLPVLPDLEGRQLLEHPDREVRTAIQGVLDAIDTPGRTAIPVITGGCPAVKSGCRRKSPMCAISSRWAGSSAPVTTCSAFLTI
ncbi:cache domain-containing protein [Marinobacterium aestuariivivens]|uniref:Cache domain-containing protein n=1 Tax=Marinobacterium aestuariivivens TaxID=1698799 RepID=A0ABW1ZY81_9GAMM